VFNYVVECTSHVCVCENSHIVEIGWCTLISKRVCEKGECGVGTYEVIENLAKQDLRYKIFIFVENDFVPQSEEKFQFNWVRSYIFLNQLVFWSIMLARP